MSPLGFLSGEREEGEADFFANPRNAAEGSCRHTLSQEKKGESLRMRMASEPQGNLTASLHARLAS